MSFFTFLPLPSLLSSFFLSLFISPCSRHHLNCLSLSLVRTSSLPPLTLPAQAASRSLHPQGTVTLPKWTPHLSLTRGRSGKRVNICSSCSLSFVHSFVAVSCCVSGRESATPSGWNGVPWRATCISKEQRRHNESLPCILYKLMFLSG